MNAQEFGSFVQMRRRALDMNQAQLAEKLHVTAKAVSRWERGVGFPSIELLQPLAEALEVSIAELMQSKLIEKELSKESAEKLVSETVNTIQKQEALTWKRKMILYGGYAIFFVVYMFLGNVGREIQFSSRWTGIAVGIIGVFIWHWGTRALYCLLTGEPFFRKLDPKWRTKRARLAGAVFLLGFAALLLVLYLLEKGNVWRDWVVVLSLTAMIGSGIYINQIEQEQP